MNRMERWMKTSSFGPLRIAGEVLFGTWGEHWERKRLSGIL
ncbi:Uncharacterised protein [uncultured archaeon]|nr:Uncharacterised protein [uncultured archaeon]